MNDPKKDVIGLAWYTAEEWEALRRVSADRGDMDDSYAEWLAGAEEYLRALRESGLNVVPVPIQVSELVAWCKKNKRRIDIVLQIKILRSKRRGKRRVSKVRN